MRITPAGSEAPGEPIKPKPSQRSGFAALVDAGESIADPQGSVESASFTAATSPLAPCPPPDRDALYKRATRQGNALLSALSALQAGLLGASTADARQQLAGLASMPLNCDEPALEAALHAIAVRAAVELAKIA
jgi:hypothetical protein